MIQSQKVRSAIAFVCVGVFGYSAAPGKGQAPKASEAKVQIAEHECWPKGGIGIVNTGLYIDLKSKGNELILAEGKRWNGASTKEKQVVFVSGQRVVSGPEVPPDFKLETACVVSFEGEKVFFFDFTAGKGGFYIRNLN